MSISARLNDVPTPVWIGTAVFGFLLWWPLGLAILAYMIWSGKMRCCGLMFGNWNHAADNGNRARGWLIDKQTSGNQAFDHYRAETLRRLEQEQREFADFLVRLRTARDKAEFDQFMSERRAAPEQPSV